jgi:hypothetical protein
MTAQSAPQITQPQTNAPSAATGLEARVFTMPQRYRHGAQTSLHQPEKKEASKPSVEVRTPGVPAPPIAPPKLATPGKAKRSLTKKIIVIGASALLVLGVGGFFLVRSAQPPVVSEPTPALVRPVPTPPTPPSTPSVETPVETPDTTGVFPMEIVPGTDTDSDGLTDAEEELVYRTDPRKPDTDADGFLDGNEVFHRYNPGGTAPGTLLESGLVVEVAGVDGGFDYLHPAQWEAEQMDDGWILDSGTGEGFRISTRIKPLNEALDDWLKRIDREARPTFGLTKNGHPLAQVDQLTAYIDLGDLVLVVVYDTGVKARVDYLQTFQMMINSVEIREPAL